MKKSRKLQHRRDRRKAKASRWRRQGKGKMGAVVGHGPNAGSSRVQGLDPLSQDSLEAIFRRNGVELSPAETPTERERPNTVKTRLKLRR